jgi:hypothetical protein
MINKPCPVELALPAISAASPFSKASSSSSTSHPFSFSFSLFGRRSPGSQRRGKGGGDDFDFDSLLLRALDDALVETVGESGAVAVKFYIDTSSLRLDPQRFEESLGKMFGRSNAGQELIKKKIKRVLARLLEEHYSIKIPVEEWENGGKTFSQFILRCRAEYNEAINIRNSSSSSSSANTR